MNPTIEGEVAVNPFDFWDGCNFKMRIAKVAGYPNYDKSLFDGCTPLLNGDDAKIQAIWESEYSLKEFTDAKQFKTYEELKLQFEKVIGNVAGKRSASAADVDEPKPRRTRAPKEEPVAAPVEEDSAPFESDTPSTDEDDLSYFEKLANGE